jgi:hypothetical protein
MDINKFEYVIRNFDVENKTLNVEFSGGGWTEISLVEPLPKNMEEVDVIVSRFTGMKQHTASETSDLSFISDCVDKPRIAERLTIPMAVFHVRDKSLPSDEPKPERKPHPHQVMVLKPFRV